MRWQGSSRNTKPYVITDRTVEQEAILVEDGDLGAYDGLIDPAQFSIPNPDITTVVVKLEE
jgi:hypothetical protein